MFCFGGDSSECARAPATLPKRRIKVKVKPSMDGDFQETNRRGRMWAEVRRQSARQNPDSLGMGLFYRLCLAQNQIIRVSLDMRVIECESQMKRPVEK